MSGKSIGSMVNGSSVEPAASIAARMTSGTRFVVYHVPIITIAASCAMNALLASGYCIWPMAPSCMIPSSNSCFQRLKVWTMLSSVHGTSPRVAATNFPGSTLSAIAWIVSMLNPAWAAPWTKHVTSLASKVSHTLFHESQSVGASSPYSSNRSWLIQTMPENTAPDANALSSPSTVSASTPVGDSRSFQSGPSACSTAGVRSIALGPNTATPPFAEPADIW